MTTIIGIRDDDLASATALVPVLPPAHPLDPPAAPNASNTLRPDPPADRSDPLRPTCVSDDYRETTRRVAVRRHGGGRPPVGEPSSTLPTNQLGPQTQLAPFAPLLEEIELAGWSSMEHELSGNFHDWLTLNSGRLMVSVGQALDPAVASGIEAALSAQAAWTAVRAHAQHLPDAGKILSQVARTIWTGSVGGQFTSLAVALVDTVGGRVSLAVAGKCLAIRIRASSCTPLSSGQPPLGGDPDTAYLSHTFELCPRERLALVVGSPACESDPCGRSIAEQFQGLDAPTHRRMSAGETLARVRKGCQNTLTGQESSFASIAVVRRR